MIVLVGPGEWAAGARAALLDGESHHLRVRRARDGETVEVRDGAGLIATGRLIANAGDWEVALDRAERRPAPSALVLGVGAGDRDRFAAVVEKGVELGVTAVVPVVTERAASVASRVRASHLDRARRQALEAVKQSGNPWSCAIEDPIPLADFLGRTASGVRWLADGEGEPPPASLEDGAVAVLVGPEGGLTAAERDTCIAAGCRPIWLGPHVLRFETAALAAAAAVQAARLRGRHG